MKNLDKLPMFIWKPLMKATALLYWRLGFKPAGRIWRAL